MRVHVFLINRLTYAYGFFMVGTLITFPAIVCGYYFRGMTDFTAILQLYGLVVILGIVIQIIVWLGFRPK